MSNYDPQLALRQTIAGVLDAPSVYMGGPSKQNLRKADRIIERLRSDSRLMEALRAGMETSVTLMPDLTEAIRSGVPLVRHLQTVPKGHFWRGVPESNRHQCRNCGEHYDKHLHTDEASRCPTANR